MTLVVVGQLIAVEVGAVEIEWGLGEVSVFVDGLHSRNRTERNRVGVDRIDFRRVVLDNRTVDRASDREYLRDFVVDVCAQRETVDRRIDVCSFLIVEASRKEIAEAVGSTGERQVVFLFVAGVIHYIHPVDIGKFRSALDTFRAEDVDTREQLGGDELVAIEKLHRLGYLADTVAGRQVQTGLSGFTALCCDKDDTAGGLSAVDRA